MENLIEELKQIGAVKKGSFILKSGQESSIYLDLRLIISYPLLLKKLTERIWEKIKSLSFDVICGVPYTALPLATALSLTYDIPMILVRKEKKQHGTKKSVEGVFKPGARCLLIEDVITSGLSIEQTLSELHAEGIQVKDIVVVVDRQQGGSVHLNKQGFQVHSLTTLTEVLKV